MPTKIQQKILDALSDGRPHKKTELLLAVLDEHSEIGVLQMHISILRKALRPIGQDIVCVTNGSKRESMYMHVRLIGNPYRGGSSE